jgi:MtN3 and saliva related transmembrane protein
VPQALRAVRTRQTKDISLLTFLMLVIGILLWLTYGLLIGDLPLILSNTITLVLASAILATKLRYG